MSCRTVVSLVTITFALSACGEGVVRSGHWRETGESTSFNGMVSNSGWRVDESPPPSEGSDDTSAVPVSPEPDPLESESGEPLTPLPPEHAKGSIDVHMGTVSRCHASEYDHILKILRSFVNPGTGKYDKKFIVSLETNAVSLGHTVVDAENLKSPAQDLKQNVVERFAYPMEVTIPAALAKEEFTAYLFACIDLDEDGSCTDEAAGSLEGFDFKSDVVYFVPVKVKVIDGKVSYRTVQEGEVVDDPNSGSAAATKVMQSLLKNLKGKDFGADENGNPLDIIITVTGDRACPPPPPKAPPYKRTSGCFVANTKVDIGDGTLVAVEKLYAGTALTTAHGDKATTIKWVAGVEKHKVVEIKTDGGQTLTVTRFHPMATLDGMKLAKDLTEADSLFNGYWEPVRITSLRRKAYSGLVYNFELPGIAEQDHLLVAGGLVTGDLHLQQQMSAHLK